MMTASMPRILPGNAQNRGDRDYQEDAFGFTDRNDPSFVRHAGVAAVLCDGMGGLQFGAESATLAVDTFLDEYRRKLPSEAPGVGLRRAALRANDAVFRFARENGVVQRTGCTLVAVVARGVELHCIHAGDSRAYLFSGGRLERLTVDHTYARRLEQQVSQGQMSAEDAASHPQREHLTSNLGRQDLTELDLLDPPRKLAPTDWILLCSDGLHGMLSDDEIAAELHGNSQDAAQRLVKRVTDRPEPEKDNVTVVIMQVGADGALMPSHHTWQSGRPVSESSAKVKAVDFVASSRGPSAGAQSKPAMPRWVWPLMAAPLLLALATWVFWPAPPPSPNNQPVTSGFVSPQTPKGSPPVNGQAVSNNSPTVIQDLPNQALASAMPTAAKDRTTSSPKTKPKDTSDKTSGAKPASQADTRKPGEVSKGNKASSSQAESNTGGATPGGPTPNALTGQASPAAQPAATGATQESASQGLNLQPGWKQPTSVKSGPGAVDGAPSTEPPPPRSTMKLDTTGTPPAAKGSP